MEEALPTLATINVLVFVAPIGPPMASAEPAVIRCGSSLVLIDLLLTLMILPQIFWLSFGLQFHRLEDCF